jgi:hypothetical protein
VELLFFLSHFLFQIINYLQVLWLIDDIWDTCINRRKWIIQRLSNSAASACIRQHSTTWSWQMILWSLWNLTLSRTFIWKSWKVKVLIYWWNNLPRERLIIGQRRNRTVIFWGFFDFELLETCQLHTVLLLLVHLNCVFGATLSKIRTDTSLSGCTLNMFCNSSFMLLKIFFCFDGPGFTVWIIAYVFFKLSKSFFVWFLVTH